MLIPMIFFIVPHYPVVSVFPSWLPSLIDARKFRRFPYNKLQQNSPATKRIILCKIKKSEEPVVKLPTKKLEIYAIKKTSTVE